MPRARTSRGDIWSAGKKKRMPEADISFASTHLLQCFPEIQCNISLNLDGKWENKENK